MIILWGTIMKWSVKMTGGVHYKIRGQGRLIGHNDIYAET